MNIQDIVVGSLCSWREARGGGQTGMQSIFNVLQNRATKRNTDVYTEATRFEQFSSMTAPGDPELGVWPNTAHQVDYQAWEIALNLAQTAANGGLTDLTKGATLYYAPHGLTPDEISPTRYALPDGTLVSFPKSWNRDVVKYTVTIADQLFFTE